MHVGHRDDARGAPDPPRPARWLLPTATAALVTVAVVVRGRAAFGHLALAAVMVPLERVGSLRPQRVLRPGWRTDVVHFLVNNVLAAAGLLAVVAPLVVALRLVLPVNATHVGAQPWGLQFAEAFVVAEVCAYWSHRASHAVPWLWRFHSVHHSVEEMDWLAAARLHPLDLVFRQACVVLPLAVLGFTKAAFGGVLVVFTVQAIFVHANVRWRFGPLRWLVATPAFHHWHHASTDSGPAANFAGELPVLDALFMTLHLPGQRWPAAYGLDRPPPAGYLRQLAVPFRQPLGA